jgi:hypothetical protein
MAGVPEEVGRHVQLDQTSIGPALAPASSAVEHEFYDQREASRYRTLHESRQDGDLPF